jgi:hypothetical protein
VRLIVADRQAGCAWEKHFLEFPAVGVSQRCQAPNFPIPMSEIDLCPFKYLVVQAGGLRGRKTFLGFSAVRDFAANLD